MSDITTMGLNALPKGAAWSEITLIPGAIGVYKAERTREGEAPWLKEIYTVYTDQDPRTTVAYNHPWITKRVRVLEGNICDIWWKVNIDEKKNGKVRCQLIASHSHHAGDEYEIPHDVFVRDRIIQPGTVTHAFAGQFALPNQPRNWGYVVNPNMTDWWRNEAKERVEWLVYEEAKLDPRMASRMKLYNQPQT